MEKEFIPYELSVKLKELGFDEPCFKTMLDFDITYESDIKMPLYQQAFRWLYQKLDIEKGIMPLDIESQQLLLRELIDKVLSKHLLV